MRQPGQRAVGDHRQVFELKAPARLAGQRHHDSELEVAHARLPLQLGVEGGRQQGDCAQQLEPGAPLAMAQPPEPLGGPRAWLWRRNKLTLQLLINSSKLKLQLYEF